MLHNLQHEHCGDVDQIPATQSVFAAITTPLAITQQTPGDEARPLAHPSRLHSLLARQTTMEKTWTGVWTSLGLVTCRAAAAWPEDSDCVRQYSCFRLQGGLLAARLIEPGNQQLRAATQILWPPRPMTPPKL